MPTQRAFFFRRGCARQHGAALMVMLVILIIGAAAILVNRLNSSTIKIARDNATAQALALAKDALIGYAASDSNRPGELPCPDVNDDGKLTMGTDYSGSNCVSPIGRLPWKTLGLPELRDSAGEHLWYAVSKAFWANGNSPINSDTQGNLTISGTSTASNIIAIVFSPGNALSGQNHSVTQSAACATTGSTVAANLCATNYLEGSNANPSTVANPNTAYQTNAIGNTFNDQMITISHDQLFAPVEKRIAREVKNCLDDYAAEPSNTHHRYPWAALVSNTSSWPNRAGDYNVRFGRVPEIPDISTTSGSPPTGTLLSLIQAVQTALNNYINNPVSGNLSTLNNQGDQLKDYSGSTSAAVTAGTTADNCSGMSCTTTLQSQLDTAMGKGPPDSTMPADWTSASCQSFFRSTSPQSYWSNWRDLVFFQVADGYQPGGGGTFTPLHISGSGNTVADNNTYRAAVLIGRQALPGQVRPSYTNPPDNYLETLGGNSNSHQSAIGVAPATNFISYKSFDPSYPTVNDLVLCLDGAGTNPGSVCK